MGTAIPEASRTILNQWQAAGLNIEHDSEVANFNLAFDVRSDRYNILEQPIPKSMTVDQVRAMWVQGLWVNFDSGEPHGIVPVVSEFNWKGFYKGPELIERLSIPAQPIPEKLLQEPFVSATTDIEHHKAQFIINSPQITESDPNGLDPHAPGAKLDAGKNRLGLVLGGFARALEEVGKVGTYGANKYSDNGWKKVENGLARYEDAMVRHWLAQKKDWVDVEAGLLHQAQVVWNALAVLELMLADEDLWKSKK